MTWGLIKEKDCYVCANQKRCYVNNAAYNLANILTSVDRLVPPADDPEKWECAGGTLKMECSAFKPKEQ